jgi:HSP20 family protein
MALVRFTRRPSRIGFPAIAGSAGFPTIEDVESRLNRFIERALNEPFGGATLPEALGWVPAMDIIETAKELTLTAELPGIDQKDVDISVEDGVLTIRGEKSEERKEEQDKKVYLYERSYGSFERSFALPSTVDGAKITADFAKGILKVHMPKDGEAKPKGRKVEVQSK